MLYLVYLFLAAIVLRIVVNLSKYMQSRYFFEGYKGYVTGTEEFNLLQHKSQILQLFKGAGVKDSYVSYVQPVGYGYIGTGNISVFQNLGNARQDIAFCVFTFFEESIGTYRRRMWESLNPLFWIDSLINLPRNLLAYLGVPPESVITRILQLVYWLAATVSGFIFAIYRPDIEAIVRTWISQIVP